MNPEKKVFDIQEFYRRPITTPKRFSMTREGWFISLGTSFLFWAGVASFVYWKWFR